MTAVLLGWGFILGMFVMWVCMSYKHDCYKDDAEEQILCLQQDLRRANAMANCYEGQRNQWRKSYFAYDELESLPDVNKKEDLPN